MMLGKGAGKREMVDRPTHSICLSYRAVAVANLARPAAPRLQERGNLGTCWAQTAAMSRARPVSTGHAALGDHFERSTASTAGPAGQNAGPHASPGLGYHAASHAPV
jgi:hypothetical protein